MILIVMKEGFGPDTAEAILEAFGCKAEPVADGHLLCPAVRETIGPKHWAKMMTELRAVARVVNNQIRESRRCHAF